MTQTLVGAKRDWCRLAEIVTLREQGLRIDDIAERLGRSRGRVAQLLWFCKKYGHEQIKLKASQVDVQAFDREKRLAEIRKFNRDLRTRAKQRGLVYP